MELRLDFLSDLDVEKHVPLLAQACALVELQCIVTYRPTWEGGKYAGPESLRLAALR